METVCASIDKVVKNHPNGFDDVIEARQLTKLCDEVYYLNRRKPGLTSDEDFINYVTTLVDAIPKLGIARFKFYHVLQAALRSLTIVPLHCFSLGNSLGLSLQTFLITCLNEGSDLKVNIGIRSTCVLLLCRLNQNAVPTMLSFIPPCTADVAFSVTEHALIVGCLLDGCTEEQRLQYWPTLFSSFSKMDFDSMNDLVLSRTFFSLYSTYHLDYLNSTSVAELFLPVIPRLFLSKQGLVRETSQDAFAQLLNKLDVASIIEKLHVVCGDSTRALFVASNVLLKYVHVSSLPWFSISSVVNAMNNPQYAPYAIDFVGCVVETTAARGDGERQVWLDSFVVDFTSQTWAQRSARASLLRYLPAAFSQPACERFTATLLSNTRLFDAHDGAGDGAHSIDQPLTPLIITCLSHKRMTGFLSSRSSEEVAKLLHMLRHFVDLSTATQLVVTFAKLPINGKSVSVTAQSHVFVLNEFFEQLCACQSPGNRQNGLAAFTRYVKQHFNWSVKKLSRPPQDDDVAVVRGKKLLIDFWQRLWRIGVGTKSNFTRRRITLAVVKFMLVELQPMFLSGAVPLTEKIVSELVFVIKADSFDEHKRLAADCLLSDSLSRLTSKVCVTTLNDFFLPKSPFCSLLGNRAISSGLGAALLYDVSIANSNKSPGIDRVVEFLIDGIRTSTEALDEDIYAAAMGRPPYQYVSCLREICRRYKNEIFFDDTRPAGLFVMDIVLVLMRLIAVSMPMLCCETPEAPALDTDTDANTTVTPHPNVVTVCTWRCVKEAVVTMSDLCRLFAVRATEIARATNRSAFAGACSPELKVQLPMNPTLYELFYDVAAQFERFLFVLRHRGAFELISLGLVDLYMVLVNAGNNTWDPTQFKSTSCRVLNGVGLVHRLAGFLAPLFAIEDEDGAGGESGAQMALRFSSDITRRSAGLPLLVQSALHCLVFSKQADALAEAWRLVDARLLHLVESYASVDDIAKLQTIDTLPIVHAINILNILLRDAKLTVSLPKDFIDRCLAASLRVLSSGATAGRGAAVPWTVRNSAAMLLDGVTRKVFGAPRPVHRVGGPSRDGDRVHLTTFAYTMPVSWAVVNAFSREVMSFFDHQSEVLHDGSNTKKDVCDNVRMIDEACYTCISCVLEHLHRPCVMDSPEERHKGGDLDEMHVCLSSIARFLWRTLCNGSWRSRLASARALVNLRCWAIDQTYSSVNDILSDEDELHGTSLLLLRAYENTDIKYESDDSFFTWCQTLHSQLLRRFIEKGSNVNDIFRAAIVDSHYARLTHLACLGRLEEIKVARCAHDHLSVVANAIFHSKSTSPTIAYLKGSLDVTMEAFIDVDSLARTPSFQYYEKTRHFCIECSQLMSACRILRDNVDNEKKRSRLTHMPLSIWLFLLCRSDQLATLPMSVLLADFNHCLNGCSYANQPVVVELFAEVFHQSAVNDRDTLRSAFDVLLTVVGSDPPSIEMCLALVHFCEVVVAGLAHNEVPFGVVEIMYGCITHESSFVRDYGAASLIRMVKSLGGSVAGLRRDDGTLMRLLVLFVKSAFGDSKASAIMAVFAVRLMVERLRHDRSDDEEGCDVDDDAKEVQMGNSFAEPFKLCLTIDALEPRDDDALPALTTLSLKEEGTLFIELLRVCDIETLVSSSEELARQEALNWIQLVKRTCSTQNEDSNEDVVGYQTRQDLYEAIRVIVPFL